MGMMQKRKGKVGERELAGLLRDLLGSTITRNLQQSRDGGADIDGVPFAMEVKRAARPRLAEWWQQACVQAEATGGTPCLAWRIDRYDWQFMLPLGAVHQGFDPSDYSLTITVGLPAFAAITLESYSESNPR
jgi:Holliday junction resolvase